MKKFVLFIIVFSFSLTLFSQQILPIRRREFKIIPTGFKEAWKAIQAGNIYFDLGLGSYPNARKEYLSAYRYNPNNAELNYMIGVCYLFTDNKFESLKYLKKAFKLRPDVSDDIRYLLGRAYHCALDFENAILVYSEYKKQLDPDRERDLPRFHEVINLINQCHNGKEIVSEPKRVVILNLGENINSEFDDYNSIISKDGSEMYFTSRRMQNDKSPRSRFDNKFYEDIYYSKKINNKWKQAERLSKKINKRKNKGNNAAVAISNDGKELYSYIGKPNHGDIFISEGIKGEWSIPKRVPGDINTPGRETSLCFSTDGNTMYFISDDPKTSFGGSDIYYVIKNAKGKWKKPKRFSNIINTKFNEIGVSLSPNDSTLYFSSNGHNTMGGYDIFKCEIMDNGLWSAPKNIGYPINTADDDVFYVEAPGGKHAYYSTIRESGIGGKDIYKVIFLGAEKQMMQSGENVMIAGYPVNPNLFFQPPQLLSLDTSLLMTGTITDSENDNPVIARMEIIDSEQSTVIATSISDASGKYKIKVPLPKQYGIQLLAKGYLLYLDAIDLKNETYEKEVIRNFKMDRIEVGAKVVLKNIYFEFGKAALKPESYAALDNVVRLLEENESLRIEISGHTDNVGSMKSNMRLSQNRAKSVVNYLTSKGISSSRLDYKGYAFSQPIAPNTTEEGRAKNRRVEFKILSK